MPNYPAGSSARVSFMAPSNLLQPTGLLASPQNFCQRPNLQPCLPNLAFESHLWLFPALPSHPVPANPGISVPKILPSLTSLTLYYHLASISHRLSAMAWQHSSPSVLRLSHRSKSRLLETQVGSCHYPAYHQPSVISIALRTKPSFSRPTSAAW